MTGDEDMKECGRSSMAIISEVALSPHGANLERIGSFRHHAGGVQQLIMAPISICYADVCVCKHVLKNASSCSM